MSVASNHAGRPAADRLSRILFVSHEAMRTGAPMFLLHFLRWLKANTSQPFEILLGKGGPLEAEFARLGKIHGPTAFAQDSRGLQAFDLIYSNTCCNGLLLETLPYGNVPIVTHVHELDGGVDSLGARNFAGVFRQSNHYIACAGAVAEMLQRCFRIPAERISTHYEIIAPQGVAANVAASDPATLRATYDLPENAFIIAACGTVDIRKAPDLFVQLAARLRRQFGPERPLRCLWIGKSSQPELERMLVHDLRRAGLDREVRFIGELENPHGLLALADLFCLTSREDPFPLVMLEAASLGKPVVCFENSGGAVEFCAHGGGVAVPFLDVAGMADACVDLLAHPEKRAEIGGKGAESIRAHFNVDVIAPRLWSEIAGFLAQPPPTPAARLRDDSFAEIANAWSPDHSPQRTYLALYRVRHAAYAQARELAAAGRAAEAGGLLVRTVRTVMDAKDPLALVETLAEVSEEMAAIDPAKARYFLAEAEKAAKAGGGRLVFSTPKAGSGLRPKAPRRVTVLPVT